jgi:hypothetical protein
MIGPEKHNKPSNALIENKKVVDMYSSIFYESAEKI